MRILKLTSPHGQASNLYKESKIYTLMQITTIKNYQFLYDQIKKNLPKNFNNYYTVKKNQINIIQEGKNWMFKL